LTDPSDARVAVVLITHNGWPRLARTLRHLTTLPERPPVVVVDNASTDGTTEALRRDFPAVQVIALPDNRGAGGRNVGVAAVRTPYVAFAEDDSWYEPGALATATELLDAHPEIALINAHVLVGEDRRVEPLHADMLETPLPADRDDLPGHRILSFLEGTSVIRRSAFMAAGGFDRRFPIGGPEEHLAADLLAHGWELRYVPEVIARHVPDHKAPSPAVRRMGVRNALWFAWERRPVMQALRWTAHVLRTSPANAATARGLADALRGLPRLRSRRRPLPPHVEADMQLLDESKMRSGARSYRS
jgi:N-acetylglucosaminyl-diphospho-decaprenol L-rhamnosyltransferase